MKRELFNLNHHIVIRETRAFKVFRQLRDPYIWSRICPKDCYDGGALLLCLHCRSI